MKRQPLNPVRSGSLCLVVCGALLMAHPAFGDQSSDRSTSVSVRAQHLITILEAEVERLTAERAAIMEEIESSGRDLPPTQAQRDRMAALEADAEQLRVAADERAERERADQAAIDALVDLVRNRPEEIGAVAVDQRTFEADGTPKRVTASSALRQAPSADAAVIQPVDAGAIALQIGVQSAGSWRLVIVGEQGGFIDAADLGTL